MKRGLNVGAASGSLMEMGFPRVKRRWWVVLIVGGLVTCLLVGIVKLLERPDPPPLKISFVVPHITEFRSGDEVRHRVSVQIENLADHFGPDVSIRVSVEGPKANEFFWDLGSRYDIDLSSGGISFSKVMFSVQDVTGSEGTGRIEVDFEPGHGPARLRFTALKRAGLTTNLVAWGKRQYRTLFEKKRLEFVPLRTVGIPQTIGLTPLFPTNVVAEVSASEVNSDQTKNARREPGVFGE